MLAYKLSYQYSKASLSFDALKGSDHINLDIFVTPAPTKMSIFILLASRKKSVVVVRRTITEVVLGSAWALWVW